MAASSPQPERPQTGRSILGRVAGLGLARPTLTLIIAGLVLVVCGVLVAGLPVSTSRYNLVAEENPHQAKMLAFFDRFGYPDALVMVVSGGTNKARRGVIDQLLERFEKIPELKGRTLGRVQIEQVAEVLLLMQPQLIPGLREHLAKDTELADVVEGGLPRWFATMREQIDEGLEGDEDEPLDDELADEGLGRMAALLRALDAQIAGRSALDELPKMTESVEVPRGFGVDQQGYLVGDHGRFHIVALFPKLEGAEGYQVKPLVAKIRAARDQLDTGEVETRLTGVPALVSDELSIVTHGLWVTTAATSGGILLLLVLAFRSVRYTVLTLLPLAIGMVLTLALVRGIYGSLNLITSNMVSVLLAMGIDFGVFVLSRYGENVRGGAEPAAAIRGALSKAGPGMIIGGVTTIAAFLLVTTTEFTAYSELGVITSMGLLLMLAVTFVLLPTLIWVAGRGKQLRAPELPGVARIPDIVRKARIPIPAMALVLAGLSALVIGRVEYNNRYFDFLPEGTESADGLELIEKDKSVSPIIVGIPADSVLQARELAEKLRQLPEVAAVQSPTDLLPELTAERLTDLRKGFAGLKRDVDFDKLRRRQRSTKEVFGEVEELCDTLDEVAFQLRKHERPTANIESAQKACERLKQRVKALPDTASLAAVEQSTADILERAWTTARRVADRGKYLPEDLPPVFLVRFASLDRKALAVYATPAGDIWDTETARRFQERVEAIDPEAAGLAVNIYVHQKMIRDGFETATFYSVLLVIGIVFIAFRRVGDTLLAFVPVALGTCWMLGLMAVLELKFNVANIVVLPLIVGVGIDSGAHIVHRWRQSAEEHGGIGKLEEVIRGTGSAVLLASLTTGVGFAALMLGDYGAMKALGSVMAIGVSCCLLGSIFVLPSILVLLRKAE